MNVLPMVRIAMANSQAKQIVYQDQLLSHHLKI